MLPHRVFFGDNLTILQSLPSESVDLIYIDPPFNTGKTQSRTQIKTMRLVDDLAEGEASSGDRTGFGGRRYQTVQVGRKAYADLFDDYLAFLEPRLLEAYRLLKPHGSLYF